MAENSSSSASPYGIPIERSNYFQFENIPTPRGAEGGAKLSERTHGIHVVARSPSQCNSSRDTTMSPVNRILRHQQSAQVHNTMEPTKSQCQCGHSKIFEQLRLQNESLKKELLAYERSFSDRVNIEVRQRQLQTTKHLERRIEELQLELNRQATNSQHEESNKQHLRTYQKYIDNLERAKDSLSEELERARKQIDRLGKLQQKVNQLQQQKQQLNETLSQREEYFNQTVAQINIENQHRNSSYYTEELERTNTFLQKENKRLNSILLERLRLGAYF